MSDDGNVISLPFTDAKREHNQRESELAELPVGRAPYSLGTCKHERSVVDARARTVKCSSCNVDMDPIEVLDRIAHDFAEPLRLAQQAHKRRRELQESIGRLEREERNAKARLRTARKQALKFDGPAIDAALVERYSLARWGAKDFHMLPDPQQEHARKAASELVEAYIAVLTGANTSEPAVQGQRTLEGKR